MKSGVTLQQMLTEVKRQSESKEDYLIAPNRLRMESYGKEMFLHLSDDSGTGLNTRQFICSVLAVGVAVGIYFALQPYVGTEEIGWMCILGAAPFAACGFFTYHGMTAEQVLWAWFKSEILCPKRLVFKSDSYYYEAMQPAIRAGMKRKRGLPMKKNTHNSEETA